MDSSVESAAAHRPSLTNPVRHFTTELPALCSLGKVLSQTKLQTAQVYLKRGDTNTYLTLLLRGLN